MQQRWGSKRSGQLKKNTQLSAQSGGIMPSSHRTMLKELVSISGGCSCLSLPLWVFDVPSINNPPSPNPVCFDIAEWMVGKCHIGWEINISEWIRRSGFYFIVFCCMWCCYRVVRLRFSTLLNCHLHYWLLCSIYFIARIVFSSHASFSAFPYAKTPAVTIYFLPSAQDSLPFLS